METLILCIFGVSQDNKNGIKIKLGMLSNDRISAFSTLLQIKQAFRLSKKQQ